MIESNLLTGIVTITCDKCGKTQSSNQDNQASFYIDGWALNTNAKKYFHLCRGCQKSSQRKAHDFIKSKFKYQ